QRKIGRPITWTALLTVRGSDYHVGMAELNSKERAAGADVWPQVSVRPLTFSMTMAEPFTFNMNPVFAKLMGKPVDERLARYRDPEWRHQAQHELDHGKFFRPNWAGLEISETDKFPELLGRSIAGLAAERGVSPLDAVRDIAS